MATGYEAEVIRYLRRKSSSGFESPTYLGAEQRFVSALRNSSVNNLEEQYILGTDTYSETYVDEYGNKIVETSYHINDAMHSVTDYYKIISTTYSNGIINEDFFFDNDNYNMQKYLPKLQQIDWLRSNNMWIGRTIRDNGKVLNSEEAISLTCAVIKREIGLPLTKEEKQKEKQISEKM